MSADTNTQPNAEEILPKLNNMPCEILLQIFIYVGTPRDILALGRCSQRLNAVCKNLPGKHYLDFQLDLCGPILTALILTNNGSPVLSAWLRWYSDNREKFESVIAGDLGATIDKQCAIICEAIRQEQVRSLDFCKVSSPLSVEA
jgi:hypothetical protein